MNGTSGTDPVAIHLAAHGLVVHGQLRDPVEPLPEALVPARPARGLLLIGNAGGAFWSHFTTWRATVPPDMPNPLDAWSRMVIDAAADLAGGRAVYPSDRPYLPFQRWAMAAQGIRPSPLGILMHPIYGLWHAYRGAVLLDELPRTALPRASIHLCDECQRKPCMNACPVAAHAPEQFAYADCLSHVRSSQSSACRTQGCMDRNACPFGADYRYSDEQQAFHMAAFERAGRAA